MPSAPRIFKTIKLISLQGVNEVVDGLIFSNLSQFFKIDFIHLYLPTES
jgi:hypothetical protein